MNDIEDIRLGESAQPTLAELQAAYPACATVLQTGPSAVEMFVEEARSNGFDATLASFKRAHAAIVFASNVGLAEERYAGAAEAALRALAEMHTDDFRRYIMGRLGAM